jgi:anaerobic magnesium-protoporphyrin IX monomethyl ester cyclase
MSEVLFGQSYYLRFDPKLWEVMQPYPPLGTMYAASFLRSHGYDVALFDAMLAGSEEEWAVMLDSQRPRFAIIYEDNFNYLSKMCLLRMRQAAFTMIAMAKARGCVVIVCGSDASDQAAAFLQKGADYVLIGEGEYTLLELMDAFAKQTLTGLSSILGLAYKENGRVLVNSRRADIKSLDELPFPAWDLVDVPRYRKIWQERQGYYSMNMVTTRGCPYHCNWCAKPIWGQRYNARSPQNVADEMKWLGETYHPDHIWFADDILGLKPGWLSEFATIVQKERIGIPFKCLNRADLLLREGEIDALKQAGCQITWIGAESGSQKILDAMEKGTRIEQVHEATRRLHAAGLKVGFFLQFGYPGETMEDIEKTFQMLRDCQPDDIGMSVSYPLPGTTFYQLVKEQMGEKQNWTDSSDLAMMYPGPFATAFYRQLHVVLHKEFRSRRTLRRLTHRQSVGLKAAIAMPYQAATLPLARLRLRQLAALPHTGMRPLASPLNPKAASQPTPQD